jgi:hypothetical protein
MRRLFVPLLPEEIERLRQLAQIERRRPQEQAALLIVRGLRALTAQEPCNEGATDES